MIQIVALAAALAPSALLAAPSTYDGKAVTVTGTVSKYQTQKTGMGTVAAFQLCDSACVLVIDQTAATRADGAKVTVSGTFETTFKGPMRTFHNVVLIKK
jgi:DNA/RNA endonuclease YhcR with UshA esterase domain